LDTCLNQVTQPLQRGNFATKTELNQLTQRQQELNQELRQLRDRLDASDPPQRANP
jgi:cell division protein FtsB